MSPRLRITDMLNTLNKAPKNEISRIEGALTLLKFLLQSNGRTFLYNPVDQDYFQILQYFLAPTAKPLNLHINWIPQTYNNVSANKMSTFDCAIIQGITQAGINQLQEHLSIIKNRSSHQHIQLKLSIPQQNQEVADIEMSPVEIPSLSLDSPNKDSKEVASDSISNSLNLKSDPVNETPNDAMKSIFASFRSIIR